MKRILLILILFVAMSMNSMAKTFTPDNETPIGRNTSIVKSDLMTPEVLWAMGRVGSVSASTNGKKAVYSVTYYSVEQNKSHTVLYLLDLVTCKTTLLTTGTASETSAVFFNNDTQLLYTSQGQLWVMNVDGTQRRKLTTTKPSELVDDFILSPDENRIILIRQVDSYSSIQKNPDDLPLSTGMVINDMMYKHWDHFVKTIPHPFVADFTANGIGAEQDILEGEPFECPMLPFGGIEELTWSPDSKTIAYTCRKKVGKAYSVSTDSDIFLYEIATHNSTNICKPAGYTAPKTDDTKSFQSQPININPDLCMGYDQVPLFSPDGKYVAWISMARDGYESDCARLCVYDIAMGTKTYVSKSFDSDIHSFCWDNNSKSLYFTGPWHGRKQIYSVTLNGEIKQVSIGDYDYTIQSMLADGHNLLVKRQSICQADEVYVLDLKAKMGKNLTQVTYENEYFYERLSMARVEERWVKTCDNKDMLCWVIYPPHFDPTKKYPTLLFCQGGPQSALGQGWSYRWNFQLMAANGYIVIAPNRRGVPGFGSEWIESISQDYNGLCMKDLLVAIDDIVKEPYVDSDNLGCVGASFGGYAVYWLAGHHEGRFKAFISHDGIFNLEAQYVETDEMWFVNWDLGGAPWRSDIDVANKVYADSPHHSVDKWDTPILCIHGMKDYRIMHTQGEAAFQAAKMRGIPAQLLLIPDENHWVLKPQNGVLWQRTFFNWLDKWLK